MVQAKAGAGSATLSMAMAGHKFVSRVIEGLKGAPGIIECAFVESDVTSCQWFATPCRFGPNGVEENLGLGELDEYENKLLGEAIAELQPSIDEGVDFVKSA